MDTAVLVSIVAAASGVIVTAVSYYLTKKKEREADWRKYKFEKYKEFLVSMSGNLARYSTPDSRRRFYTACNALHLIGSKGVLLALHSLIAVAGDPSLSNDAHDALLSKLIWEIRQDVGIPGTPDASEFSARLWSAGQKSTRLQGTQFKNIVR
jgi:hypothetical protein